MKVINKTYNESNINTIEELKNVIIDSFNKTIKYDWSTTIMYWKNKSIAIDWINSKTKCSCYVDLWLTYLRHDLNIDWLLYLVLTDKYIIKKFK